MDQTNTIFSKSINFPSSLQLVLKNEKTKNICIISR